VTSLAALPRLRGLAFQSAYDLAADCSTQLRDQGAVLLFQSLSERIDHGGALASLSLIGRQIGQAGGAALAAFIERSRSLTSLKVFCASNALLAPLSASMAQCRTLTSLELRSADPGMETARALAAFVQQSTSLTTLKLCRFKLDVAASAVLAAAVAQNHSFARSAAAASRHWR